MQREQQQYGLDFSSAEAERFFLIEQALRRCPGADLRHVELCRWIAATTASNGQPLRRRVLDLARKLWCSEATARRVVRDLVRWGLLVVEETGGSGGQRENAYGLDWPAIKGRLTGQRCDRPPLQTDSAPSQRDSAPSQVARALRNYPQGSAKGQEFIPPDPLPEVVAPPTRRGAGDLVGLLVERLVGLGCWPDAARGVLEPAAASGIDAAQLDDLVAAWRERGLGPGGLIARLRRWRPGQAASWGWPESAGGPDPLPMRLAAAAQREAASRRAAQALEAARQTAAAERAQLERDYGPRLDGLDAAARAELAAGLPAACGPQLLRLALLERLAGQTREAQP